MLTDNTISFLQSIRTRLILAFLVAVLLPFSGISLVLTISEWQGGRQTAITQLDTVASYQQDTVQAWTRDLKAEAGVYANILALKSGMTELLAASAAPTEPLTAAEKAALQTDLRQFLAAQAERSINFDQLFILNSAGLAVAATDLAIEGRSYRQQPVFQNGAKIATITPITYDEALDRSTFFVAQPLINAQSRVVGVLVGRVETLALENALKRQRGLGQTGHTYLVSNQRTLAGGLTGDSPTGRGLPGGTRIETYAVETALKGEVAGSASYDDFRNQPVIGVFRYLTDLQAVLIVEQARYESARAAYAVLAVNASVSLSSILVALFLALLVTRGIANPLGELAGVATRIADEAGEFTRAFGSHGVEWGRFDEMLVQNVTQNKDEVSVMALAFQAMTEQMRALVASLEQRIHERTQRLEQQTRFLQASADVGRAAGLYLDPDQLVDQVVGLIQDAFDLYYVGLFLLDEPRQWAVLRAATGQAGRAMLARGHRLAISGPAAATSMIAWAIVNAQGRVAQEAISDVVRFATPELPETQSEAALPLRSRGQVLGAISVQSRQVNAFDPAAIAALQAMCDQLAIAIDNARLFARIQQSLEAERLAYAQESRTAWEAQASRGARALAGPAQQAVVENLAGGAWTPAMRQAFRDGRMVIKETIPAENPAPYAGTQPALPSSQRHPQDRQDRAQAESARQAAQGRVVALPIKLRGAVIGVIECSLPPAAPVPRSSAGGERSQDADNHLPAEQALFLEGVAEQLAIALDGARLYAESQQKAEQERLVGEITGKMRQSLDVERVVMTAVEELYQALGLEAVSIQLVAGEEEEAA